MSDTDVSDDYEAAGPIDLMSVQRQARQQAAVSVATSIDDDPEKASRSIELGKMTGADPSVIYPDLDNFEKRQKAAVNSRIAIDNSYIQDYLNADPMHPKLSHDDLGNLDEVSATISKLSLPARIFRGPETAASSVAQIGGSIAQGAISGYRKGAIEGGGIGDWAMLAPEAKDHPFYAALQAVGWAPFEIGTRFISGSIEAITGAAHEGAKTLAKQLGSSDEGADQFAREIAALAEAEVMGLSGRHGLHGPETGPIDTVNPLSPRKAKAEAPKEEAEPEPFKAEGPLKKIMDMAQASRPWLDEGLEPPAGLNVDIDKLKAQQNDMDVKGLDGALKAAQSSATRERSPDVFVNFVRQHTDANIGISGDAVARLYGDKVPAAGDGILGFVPGLADELEQAKATGGDVHVPLADWLANVDPEIAKELHDDIRVRPGGITKGEVEAKKEAEDYTTIYRVEGKPNSEPVPEWIKQAQDESGQTEASGRWFTADKDAVDWYKKDAGPESTVHSVDIPSKDIDKYKVSNSDEKIGDRTVKSFSLDPENEFFLPRELANSKKPVYPTPLPEALPQLRAATGLEPLFSVGDRKLELKKVGSSEYPTSGNFGIGDQFHDFEMLDENGKKVGAINLSEQAGGKQLYVEMIQGGGTAKMYDPNFFGPALMRDLLRQIKEQFPDAESITGHRVSGAREKADSYMKPSASPVIKFDDESGFNDLHKIFQGGQSFDMGHGIEAYYSTELKAHQLEADRIVRDELARIAPKQATVFTPNKISMADKPGFIRRGMYSQFTDQNPIISIALDASEGILGVARHEAIHHLRQQGFFTEGEWSTLERTARDEGWKDRFQINDRYKDLPEAQKLEEAIAEGYRYWKQGNEVSPAAHGVFEKLKAFFETIRSKLGELLGHEVSWEDLFKKVDSGEVGGREGNAPQRQGAFRQAGADEPTQPFDRGSIMPKENFDRYMKAIAERHEADLASATKRAEAQQSKRQTKEWKENERAVREEVSQTIQQRPDVAADLFFGAGEYLGEKVGQRPKLDVAQLTPEQKAALPKEYVAKDGLNPDDVANLFGYPSGDAMVQRLSDYNIAKQQANMSAKDFVSRITDLETERQMQTRYGSLEKSILDDANEQAVSETQLNLLHEETLALGLQAKAQGTIDKAALKTWVQEKFAATPIGGIKLDDYLATAGRAGRLAETALLKEDFAEAFRAKQQQYLAMLFAKEAKDLDKARSQFNKLAGRYSKREVAGASPEYTDAVHDILMRLGEKVRRSIQDVDESYKLNGHTGLADFVASKEAQLRDLHTPDFLQDPAFRKPTDQLTAEEFEQVHNALKAITHNSRDELKIIKAGEKVDLEQVLGDMIDKLKSLGPPKEYEIGAQDTLKERAKSIGWSGITVESMMNRLDRGDPRGVFYQTITHHFTEASNYKDKLIRDFQKRIEAIGKVEDLDKQVENTLFEDPLTGQPFLMRRKNVLGILQNVGNKNNLIKLAKGYGLEPDSVLSWLHRNTTKEDWDRAQKIGDIFNDVFDMANTMSHSISGVGIQRLPLEPIDTPHGKYPGWYNPIKYDPLRPGKSKKLMGANPLEEEGFYRATTPQGYTKDRTGYIAPVELSLDVVPQRMKQMLNDIAMRPAVLQLSKIFYDNRFERAMTAQYGMHQAKEMIPFLRDLANAPDYKSMAQQNGGEALEFFRQNTIATLIGLNPSTVMKHGTTALFNSMNEVGAMNYLREHKNIMMETMSGNATWKMAMEKSEELQRRMRNFQELIQGHGGNINIKGSNSAFMSVREMVMNAGAKPVSLSDLFSAVPTWAAKYKMEIAASTDEGMAVSLANRAVRNAHGSSAQSNKPSISRSGGPLQATFASLYGFFSHMQQKQYELAWKARDMLSGQRDVKETIPDLVSGFVSYIIIPALIEEIVTPYSDDGQKHTWGRKAATALGLGVSSSFIGVRDFVHALAGGRDAQPGLIGTSMKSGTDVLRDLSKGPQAFTKEKAGNLIAHTFSLTGMLTGLTNAQEGKMAEYMYNYFNGKEKPKGPWDAAVGLRYGKTDHHSRSFEQWRQHTIGGR